MLEDCVWSIFLVVIRLLQQDFLHHNHATLENVWTTRWAKDARTIATKCWVTSTRRNLYNFDYESYSLAATGIFKKQKSAVYTGRYVLVVRDCEIHLVPISQIIAGNYE